MEMVNEGRKLSGMPSKAGTKFFLQKLSVSVMRKMYRDFCRGSDRDSYAFVFKEYSVQNEYFAYGYYGFRLGTANAPNSGIDKYPAFDYGFYVRHRIVQCTNKNLLYVFLGGVGMI